MTIYISMMSYTDKGMQAVRESPRRMDAASKMLEDMGGRFRDVFLTRVVFYRRGPMRPSGAPG